MNLIGMQFKKTPRSQPSLRNFMVMGKSIDQGIKNLGKTIDNNTQYLYQTITGKLQEFDEYQNSKSIEYMDLSPKSNAGSSFKHIKTTTLDTTIFAKPTKDIIQLIQEMDDTVFISMAISLFHKNNPFSQLGYPLIYDLIFENNSDNDKYIRICLEIKNRLRNFQINKINSVNPTQEDFQKTLMGGIDNAITIINNLKEYSKQDKSISEVINVCYDFLLNNKFDVDNYKSPKNIANLSQQLTVYDFTFNQNEYLQPNINEALYGTVSVEDTFLIPLMLNLPVMNGSNHDQLIGIYKKLLLKLLDIHLEKESLDNSERVFCEKFFSRPRGNFLQRIKGHVFGCESNSRYTKLIEKADNSVKTPQQDKDTIKEYPIDISQEINSTKFLEKNQSKLEFDSFVSKLKDENIKISKVAFGAKITEFLIGEQWKKLNQVVSMVNAKNTPKYIKEYLNDLLFEYGKESILDEIKECFNDSLFTNKHKRTRGNLLFHLEKFRYKNNSKISTDDLDLLNKSIGILEENLCDLNKLKNIKNYNTIHLEIQEYIPKDKLSTEKKVQEFLLRITSSKLSRNQKLWLIKCLEDEIELKELGKYSCVVQLRHVFLQKSSSSGVRQACSNLRDESEMISPESIVDKVKICSGGIGYAVAGATKPYINSSTGNTTSLKSLRDMLAIAKHKVNTDVGMDGDIRDNNTKPATHIADILDEIEKQYEDGRLSENISTILSELGKFEQADLYTFFTSSIDNKIVYLHLIDVMNKITDDNIKKDSVGQLNQLWKLALGNYWQEYFSSYNLFLKIDDCINVDLHTFKKIVASMNNSTLNSSILNFLKIIGLISMDDDTKSKNQKLAYFTEIIKRAKDDHSSKWRNLCLDHSKLTQAIRDGIAFTNGFAYGTISATLYMLIGTAPLHVATHGVSILIVLGIALGVAVSGSIRDMIYAILDSDLIKYGSTANYILIKKMLEDQDKEIKDDTESKAQLSDQDSTPIFNSTTQDDYVTSDEKTRTSKSDDLTKNFNEVDSLKNAFKEFNHIVKELSETIVDTLTAKHVLLELIEIIEKSPFLNKNKSNKLDLLLYLTQLFESGNSIMAKNIINDQDFLSRHNYFLPQILSGSVSSSYTVCKDITLPHALPIRLGLSLSGQVIGVCGIIAINKDKSKRNNQYYKEINIKLQNEIFRCYNKLGSDEKEQYKTNITSYLTLYPRCQPKPNNHLALTMGRQW